MEFKGARENYLNFKITVQLRAFWLNRNVCTKRTIMFN